MKIHIPRNVIFCLLLSASLVWGDSKDSWFHSVIIDDSIPRAYQAAIVDINNDGKPDIAALGEGTKSFVAWYENPSWKRRLISGKETKNHIDFAFYDLDDDGELELALASDFHMSKTTEGGQISWLDRKNDIDQPWTVHPIHSEPTTHRIRWADLDGNGEKALIVAPIMGVGSSGPDYDQEAVRLLSFEISDDPAKEPWMMNMIDKSLHILHGLYVEDVNKDGNDEIFTAALEGVHVFRQNDQGSTMKRLIALGNRGEGERTGSSEVAVGGFRNGEHFLTSIDPWHGNHVAVYTKPSNGPRFPLQRKVIDDSYESGHAIACGDFDGDGNDEIIGGYRGKGHSIYVYDYNHEDESWKRILVAKDVAAQGFAVGDVNGDGKLDFVAAGGATNNVKLYINNRNPK